MSKIKKTNRILISICIAILLLFFISIAIRFITRQVIILRFGIENAITDFIFFDDKNMATMEDITVTKYGQTDDYSVDWADQYPFEAEDVSLESVKEQTSSGILDRYIGIVQSLEGRIEHYAQDNLLGYSIFTETANKVEKIVGWNFTSYSEYNGIFQLKDGYWSSLKPKVNMSPHIESFANLKDTCKMVDADLLYVQAPFKISKYEDTDISGELDYSNHNADELIKGLEALDIPTLDLRERIKDLGLNQHELFFVTDHHWKPETGLWASGEICRFINDQENLNIDVTKLDTDNFYSVVYKDWFLGSFGKKVTLGKTQPEDISLLYPKYDTVFSYQIPSIGISEIGDFKITYNMEAIETKDYYNKSPYAAYNYGDRAIIKIHNEESDINNKIVIIHDSFADSVIPFMALGVSDIESIDLRYFNGSLVKYLKESNPDTVIVMYNAGEISDEIDYSTHTDILDFR